MLQSQYNENKKVTSACWTCPFGSKVAIGYSNGEIFIWSIPANPNSRTEIASDSGTQSAPLYKLNLGYKSDRIPIASLKWLQADGKASRLYIMGASDSASTNLLQVWVDFLLYLMPMEQMCSTLFQVSVTNCLWFLYPLIPNWLLLILLTTIYLSFWLTNFSFAVRSR